MTKKSPERSAAIVRTLPGEVVLKAASHCSGHNILDPKAFSDAGIPAEVVTQLTRIYKSDGSPKGSIFVAGQAVKSLEGIYGLDALRFFASDSIPGSNYAAAKKIYDKLLSEKTAKGYTPGEDGTPYQQTDKQDRATGIVPQLLNAIDEDEAQKLMTDDDWLLQEKFDGRRLLISRTGSDIVGINRTGLTVALPMPLVSAVQQFKAGNCLLDGEAVGDVYYAFDLLELDSHSLRQERYLTRLASLRHLIGDPAEGILRLVFTAGGSATKHELWRDLRRQRKEGAVFKHAEAPYSPGRPASGGNQLKLKFTTSASCIVAGVNKSKRSVGLELRDGKKSVAVGNVTIPLNHPIPAAGAIVEIRYLYAYQGGSLYQPVYLGIRDDIPAADCSISQLKFKAESEEA